MLLIDADPQGDLTTCLGWKNGDALDVTLGTLMEKIIKDEHITKGEGILHHKEGVDLIPANLELSSMEMNLVNAMSRELTLKNYLRDVKQDYDHVLIDCMPSLGMITINALAASDSVVIPVQAQYLPAKGMTQLVQTIIPLYEAKTYLRVDSSDEYALIGILLSSAEQMCKDVSRLSEDQWEAVNAADQDAENGVQPTRELEALRSTCRVAILYVLGYLYEHRDEADHKQLMLTLRSILFAVREGVF